MTEGRVTESSSRICQLLMIHMTGGAPFGFRIASVRSDGISPFAVSTIRINGKAYRAGLLEADLVLAINGFSCCSGLSHHSATKLMEYDDPELTLHILRGENLCEDDIKKSLQSLDSQIVELTDNEVQSTIAKKQLQQPVGIPAWKSKLTNSLSSHLNVSPSWLQPPPNTRPKMVDRRNDILSLSQPIEHTLTDSAPNGLTDDQVHETWTKVKTKANNDMTAGLTMAQLKMSETNESSKDLQLNNKPISELKNNNLDCSSSQNDAKQQSRWIELPSNMSMDKANDKFISESKPTTDYFDMASSTNTSDRFIDNKVEEADQNILLKQQQNNSHFRNRYRVEQTILFKPLEQARIYDAESGQFRENSSEKLPKRRSNSISCYHMYIGSGLPKPSSVVESNRGHFHHQADECSRWKPSEDNRKQFDGTVYQWANGAIKNPVTDLNQGVSKSSSTSMQLPPESSPIVSDVCMSSSVKLSQQLYPTETLSHNVDSSTSHWFSNRTIQSATTPTEQLRASPNRWETRRLQQSPPVRSFSPAVDNASLRGSHCMPMSTAKLVPATMGTVFYETPSKSILGTSKALPTMISLRSNEDEASSPVHTHFSQVNETALAKARPSKHYSDMKSLNFDAHNMHGSSKPRITSTSGFDTNQQLTQPEDHRSAHKPNHSINQTWPVTANSNSLNTFLVNEGKGGRLFARRRANSDAWIVGERDEPNKTVAKSTINDSNHLAGMHAVAKPPDVMQRRQSLTAGHLQQPVHSEIGNNSHQYRSRTAQKVMNSLSSSRPFDEMQYMNRPNCHSQRSAGQRGINQSVQHQFDLNSWQQQRGTTDHQISPSISQRFRPPQADQHPIYLHAAEANRHTAQSNTGYTDL